MKLKPYPKYKSSGVEWLGDVPEHWEVRRSDCIIESEKRQIPPASFINEEVFHYSIPAVQEFGTGVSESGESIASAKQVITEPVILVSRLNPRKATICRAEPKQLRTLASTEFIALKARKCNLRFLEYLVSTEIYRQRLDSWVQSVTRSHQRASPEQIYRFWSAWPGQAEQIQIAAYLDQETKRVDQLVAKKRDLIERLKEKRTALISRTVTRGLPPAAARAANLPENPPLKPSGLDWLGDIPAHWEIGELRRFTAFITSGSRGWAEHYSDEGTIFVRIGNLTRHSINIDLSEIQYVDPPLGAEGERTRIEEGDILFSITAYLGSVAVACGSITGAYINQHVALVRALPHHLNPRYAAYSALGDAGQLQLTGLGYGGTKIQLSLDDVKSLQICVPPLVEQVAIAAFLDAETAKLDALLAKVEEAVERLQEYRTALITAAVTGKVDVRKNAPKTPLSTKATH